MTIQPKLSVLTLTYNHGPYIRDCIESVLAQRVNFPLRHIIVEDHSDDDTRQIVMEYAEKYPHIVPFYRPSRTAWWPIGPFGNIRMLFGNTTTEYAALCDGDDYFSDPDKLQTQVDFLDEHKDCALCFHPVRVTYEDEPERERLYPPLEELPRGVRQFYYLSDLIRVNMIQTNSVVYRWRFRGGMPDWFRYDLLPSDWYWHLLHAETGRIGFINKIMSVYRRHGKGAYYLAETDRLRHRCKVGMDELEVYATVNAHFNRKFESVLFSLANGVYADWLHASQERDIDVQPLLEEATDKYPDFSRHFLSSLKLAKVAS